ncbi:NDP-hexose 2,3-dehydratase family protein [Streptomyces rishiriensis]|uniref:NDP-hexose 2,3-dehydratase family protein n=2 Tax=Streptomyces rishiriensis TaxID=68264 RepID=UPI000D595195|nr:NDP-hexose 2,3-dehydratase family protein [Streptomyces rishiriensis]
MLKSSAESDITASGSAPSPVGPAHRIAVSARAVDSPVMPNARFDAWFAARRRRSGFQVTRIPFARLTGWGFDPRTGSLVHDSGRFFSVEGLRVEGGEEIGCWEQPILVQREIGVLGILVREFDGVLHFLMQAKMEPGNTGAVRLSPTVQATRSNYSGVHKGRAIPYIDYFVRSGPRRILVDTLQSERGTWFLRKRNRHMVLETGGPVPEHEDFCWLTLGQLRALMRRDNVLSMEACSVLACLPGGAPDDGGRARHTLPEVIGMLSEVKARHEVAQHRLPLSEAAPWLRLDDEISRPDGRYFKVIAAEVHADSREILHWSQPLLAPVPGGHAALLTRRFDGVRHVLLHARVEAGSLDVAEFGPTVQCTPDNYRDLPPERRPRFLDHVLSAPREAVLYDALQSEEGARFHHAEVRYRIIDVGEGLADVPDDFVWLTARQISRLLEHSYYLNMQARTFVAVLHSLD